MGCQIFLPEELMNCQTDISSGKLFATQKLIQQYKLRAINFNKTTTTTFNGLDGDSMKKKSRSSPTAIVPLLFSQ